MSKKIALLSKKRDYGRSSYLSQVPIVASFGDRALVDITKDVKADAYITGFVEDADEFLDIREMISDAKLDEPKTLALVDPDFADDGKIYDGVKGDYITNIKKLMEVSDIITPNLTEACIITDSSYDEYKNKYSTINYESGDKEKTNELSKKIIGSMVTLFDKIRFKKNQISIITGIELYNAVLTILDVYDGDHGKRQTTCNYAEKIDGRLGAGAIFDAMYFETATHGFNLIDSLSVTTSFINNSLRYTRDQKANESDGILYEPILHDNMVVIRKSLKEKRGEIKC